MEEVLAMQTLHYTPAVEELLPNHKIKCKQLNCDSIFTNTGNYEMHLKRHHRITTQSEDKSSAQRLFYCPQKECHYHVQSEKRRNFKSLKYLRQHYQKVHAEKTEICEGCGKKFTTTGLLRSHMQNACGRRFKCGICGWDYESKEALQTHEKRKGHMMKLNKKDTKALELQKDTTKELPIDASSKQNQHQETQTNVELSPVIINHNAHEPMLNSVYSNELEDEIHSFLRDIETQTEQEEKKDNNLHSLPRRNSNSSSSFVQMLGQSTHMYTQTCDDFLSELGLADIQTQTNWSSAHQYATQSTSTGCAHDELLVSTETQTSFTQCLFDSCMANGGGDGEGTSFGNLYNTQYTQTCDEQLDGLFGDQEADDLIGSFQSAYTQT